MKSKYLICVALCLMVLSTESARTFTDFNSLSKEVQDAIIQAAPALYVLERVKKLAGNDVEKKVGLGTLLKFQNTPSENSV